MRGQRFVLSLNLTNYGKPFIQLVLQETTQTFRESAKHVRILIKKEGSAPLQVQEHLKQAFLLHRGGMFMAERREYVDILFI